MKEVLVKLVPVLVILVYFSIVDTKLEKGQALLL